MKRTIITLILSLILMISFVPISSFANDNGEELNPMNSNEVNQVDLQLFGEGNRTIIDSGTYQTMSSSYDNNLVSGSAEWTFDSNGTITISGTSTMVDEEYFKHGN